MRRSGLKSSLLRILEMLLLVSVILCLLSLYPLQNNINEKRMIIDDSFRLTSNEVLHYGLGAFRGGENISILIEKQTMTPVNFSVVTYGKVHFMQEVGKSLNYSFVASTDYYEAYFEAGPQTNDRVSFKVLVESLEESSPFAFLSLPAKLSFFFSWLLLCFMLVVCIHRSSPKPLLNRILPKNNHVLILFTLLSLLFWCIILSINNHQLGTLENWYSDHARNPYSTMLFLKFGLRVFSSPLSQLSSLDFSPYKFVTWPEMPHLYPAGSFCIFFPFGFMLENGFSTIVIFKSEILLFVVVAHCCLYLFLKHFWELNSNFALKMLAIYIFYAVLVVYAANGMFDAFALLFSLVAALLFLREKPAASILFFTLSTTLKYQAGIFLFPIALLSLMQLLKTGKKSFKDWKLAVSFGLLTVDIYTAFLSAPALFNARSQLIMNPINLFNMHSQISWCIQCVLVLLAFTVTMMTVNMLEQNKALQFLLVFSLFPCFLMPYFQPWYLPFFFVYTLLSQNRRELNITLVWVIALSLILSLGGLSFNPLQVFNNIIAALRPT